MDLESITAVRSGRPITCNAWLFWLRKFTGNIPNSLLVVMGSLFMSAVFMPTTDASNTRIFSLQEATIKQMQQAMEAGALSSVELTTMYLNRIYAYDLNGIKLNSIPVLNPRALEEAAETDRLRSEGIILGPLHGIPYTVKDSYMVAGLTVAAGSPAFKKLMAKDDAFTVKKIRESGGVLIGKTNMPPMAAGGMQRGVYGRAESPYNSDYLTAAWSSGSSNGSATATAANFAAFGMGEETISSGRSPASNNALAAYTPSRGLISIRGNWPLYPIRDVVVPHTRTVEDMLRVLDVVVADDPITEGDLWRHQKVVKLPAVTSIRPKTYLELRDPNSLKGRRVGVPKMYIGKDFGGSDPVRVRTSIIELWDKAATDLRALGAEVIEIDFPLQNNYEGDRVGTRTMEERGLIPLNWMELEFNYINSYVSEEFLKSVGDPNFPSWTNINPAAVFPTPPASVDACRGFNRNSDYKLLIDTIKAGVQPIEKLPGFAAMLRGLEETRKIDLENWMKAEKLDLIVFPANGNIGKANADINDVSYEEAWQNGNFYSNTNYVLRHLGIPSVSVSMGTMKDTGIPVNLTFIGPAYSDNDLLRYAYAYEFATNNRTLATRVPRLSDEILDYSDGKTVPPVQRTDKLPPMLVLNASLAGTTLTISGTAKDTSKIATTRVYVNGIKIPFDGDLVNWQAKVDTKKYYNITALAAETLFVVVISKDEYGNTAAATKSIKLPVSESKATIQIDNETTPSSVRPPAVIPACMPGSAPQHIG